MLVYRILWVGWTKTLTWLTAVLPHTHLFDVRCTGTCMGGQPWPSSTSRPTCIDRHCVAWPGQSDRLPGRLEVDSAGAGMQKIHLDSISSSVGRGWLACQTHCGWLTAEFVTQFRLEYTLRLWAFRSQVIFCFIDSNLLLVLTLDST